MELEEYKKLSEEELIARIEKAKKEKNAIILAHNYQKLEVQQVADYIGDSLGLSRIAAETDADVVVFCGVDFMAESAKILAPEKTVLLPEIKATCPMANMITPENLIKAKAENPDSIVVAYVNTTARVKALVDICCTSANALNIVKSFPGKEIIFVPDKNLGDYIGKTTGAKINSWDGYCYVHNFFSVEDVKRERAANPDAVFLVHPESPPKVVALADEVLSTSGMVKYVENIKNDADKKRGVIIGTEIGIVNMLRKNHPDINIRALSDFAVCGTMKMTTLPKVCWSIETGNYEITIPDDILEKASLALEKMVAVN